MGIIERREDIEAGRLDAFVDGSFAFTLTLLVIGGDVVPDSTARLLQILAGIPAFAVCFWLIAFFWHGHVRWRRRCPEADRAGTWLSLALVFFALIFVYPLHMLFAGMFNSFSGGVLPSGFALRNGADIRTLYVCYGIAFASMAGTLALLFRHAARRAVGEGRSPREAQLETLRWSVPATLGVLSALLALLLPSSTPAWGWSLPGYLYALMFLLGPLGTRFRRRHGMA